MTVNLERPPGTLAARRQFDPGDLIRVSGKVTGSFGLPNSFQPVRLDIHPSTSSGQDDGFSPIFLESRTNIAGNYWFDITLPDVVTKAVLVVTAWFPIGGAEQATIPIGIGAEPDPLPAPPSGDLFSSLATVLVLVLFMSLMTSVMPMMRSLAPGRRE